MKLANKECVKVTELTMNASLNLSAHANWHRWVDNVSSVTTALHQTVNVTSTAALIVTETIQSRC